MTALGAGVLEVVDNRDVELEPAALLTAHELAVELGISAAAVRKRAAALLEAEDPRATLIRYEPGHTDSREKWRFHPALVDRWRQRNPSRPALRLVGNAGGAPREIGAGGLEEAVADLQDTLLVASREQTAMLGEVLGRLVDRPVVLADRQARARQLRVSVAQAEADRAVAQARAEAAVAAVRAEAAEAAAQAAQARADAIRAKEAHVRAQAAVEVAEAQGRVAVARAELDGER